MDSSPVRGLHHVAIDGGENPFGRVTGRIIRDGSTNADLHEGLGPRVIRCSKSLWVEQPDAQETSAVRITA